MLIKWLLIDFKTQPEPSLVQTAILFRISWRLVSNSNYISFSFIITFSFTVEIRSFK